MASRWPPEPRCQQLLRERSIKAVETSDEKAGLPDEGKDRFGDAATRASGSQQKRHGFTPAVVVASEINSSPRNQRIQDYNSGRSGLLRLLSGHQWRHHRPAEFGRTTAGATRNTP